MAATISLNGNKSIGTVMQEFNRIYPYLTIWLYSDKEEAKKASWNYIDFDKTISDSRNKRGKDISILAHESIGEIESKFVKELGIFANICFRNSDGKWFYSGDISDKLTLLELNTKCSQENCLYGEWK